MALALKADTIYREDILTSVILKVILYAMTTSNHQKNGLIIWFEDLFASVLTYNTFNPFVS